MSKCPTETTENSLHRKQEESPKEQHHKTKVRANKFKVSSSDNALGGAKSLRQKLVNKVKSWSNKDHFSNENRVDVEGELVDSINKLDINESLGESVSSNLNRARDSLENIMKDEQNTPDSHIERPLSLPTNRNRRDSPKSSPTLNDGNKPGTSSHYWDPYDKHGRKNRKDVKRKNKKSKNVVVAKTQEIEIPVEGSALKKADENRISEDNAEAEEVENYSQYKTKNSKSVIFTNEVLVVHFNNDDIVEESKEPLKKEVDQLARNKEMRRCHLIKTQEKYNLCLF